MKKSEDLTDYDRLQVRSMTLSLLHYDLKNREAGQLRSLPLSDLPAAALRPSRHCNLNSYW